MPEFGAHVTCGFKLYPIAIVRPFGAVEGAIVPTDELDLLETDAWCDNCQKVVSLGS